MKPCCKSHLDHMPVDEQRRAARIECPTCGSILKDRSGRTDPKTGATIQPPRTYGMKVDALLTIAAPLRFTPRDFADLAIAALDQAGVPADMQAHTRTIVDAWIAINEARAIRPPDDHEQLVDDILNAGAV